MDSLKIENSKFFILKELEQLCNININVTGFLEEKSWGDWKELTIFGEVFGDTITGEININISVINNTGNLLCENQKAIIFDKFDGIDAFNIRFMIPQEEEINSIRVIPYLKLMKSAEYNKKMLPVVGVNFPERKGVVHNLAVGDSVILIAEPNNPYDNNAIKVFDSNSNHLGYIAKEWARIMSNWIEQQTMYEAKVVSKKKSAFYINSEDSIPLLKDFYVNRFEFV